jgi:hypothetical protein
MSSKGADLAQAAGRGVIGALAMSGLRVFARDLGLIEKTPPEALAEKPARGLMAQVPPDRRRAAIGALHCAVGAAGGVGFGVLPDLVRRQSWAGPAWGVLIWISYEGGVAPLLGLEHAKRVRPAEQAVLITDHLLYGYILNETRKGPQA